MTTHQSLTTEVTLIPTGMKWDDYEMSSYSIRVSWRGVPNDEGLGGWSIDNGGRTLNHDKKWEWSPRDPSHRWLDFDEAVAIADELIDTISVNGRTWQEWKDYIAARDAIQAQEAIADK